MLIAKEDKERGMLIAKEDKERGMANSQGR